SVSEGLEIVLTQPTTEKGASSSAIHGYKEEASTAVYGDKEEASSTIKIEDLAKLVANKPSSHSLVSKHKLKLEKNKAEAEAEAALLKAQPSFPNVEQLNELLVKSLQTEFFKILSSHDFSISLPTELKDLPSKFNELTEEIKGLKTQVESAQAKLKTLDALSSLLLNVIKALNKFAKSDEEAHVTRSMVKSYKEKKLKKFDFVIEDGRHVHLSEEQINNQKKLDEEAEAEADK
nr:hypothetical protein [Tanacetum cinerariifolium]